MSETKKILTYSERVSILRKELKHGGLTNSKGEIVLRLDAKDSKDNACNS